MNLPLSSDLLRLYWLPTIYHIKVHAIEARNTVNKTHQNVALRAPAIKSW